MYRTLIRRDINNNQITGRAQYRVVICYENPKTWPVKRVHHVSTGYWILLLDKKVRTGTMINPRHALFGKPKKI